MTVNMKEEKSGQLAFDTDDTFNPGGYFIGQVRRVLEDQRRELLEIQQREAELKQQEGDLQQSKYEVIRGIMDAEQVLERYGYTE